jgi:hypothetical protein
MRSRILPTALLIACLAPSVQAASEADIKVCFVPGPQDCAFVAADAIAAARRSIDVQAYNFTEPQITQALGASLRSITLMQIESIRDAYRSTATNWIGWRV